MTTPREISNSDDVIDSRDVIARIEELETALADVLPDDPNDDDVIETKQALKVLKELEEQASGSPDWKYGETLIRDSYFKEYAQELAEDCDMIPKGLHWPCTCIDWERAARELRVDYTCVEFDGVTYWIRS